MSKNTNKKTSKVSAKSAKSDEKKTKFFDRSGCVVLSTNGKLTSAPFDFDKTEHEKLTAKNFVSVAVYNRFRANILEAKAIKFDKKALDAHSASCAFMQKREKFDTRAMDLRATAEEILTGKVSRTRQEKKLAKMRDAIAALESEIAENENS